MTTTRKPSASKAGQAAKKAPAKKKTTTTAPRAQAVVPAVQPVMTPGPFGLAAFSVFLLLVMSAALMSARFPADYGAPRPVPAKPAAHAKQEATPVPSCAATAKLGLPPVGCK